MANETAADIEEQKRQSMDTYEEFKSGRLIKIYTGNETEPLYLQLDLLTNLSEVFANAIRHEHTCVSEPDVLRFPEDSPSAWQILLHWIVHRKVPIARKHDEKTALRLIHSWCLGGKYRISEFQDVLMLELLYHYDASHMDGSLDAVKMTFENTPPGSKLQKFVLGNLVEHLGTPEDLHTPGLDECGGLIGFTSELLTTIREHGDQWMDGDYLHRLPDYEHPDRDGWEAFMIGDGPDLHWVHTQRLKGLVSKVEDLEQQIQALQHRR